MTMEEYERAPAARRIRQAQAKSGVTVGAVCKALGMSDDEYRDFEWDDDEAYMSVSLHRLCSFADLVGVRPEELVSPSNCLPRQVVTMETLVGRIAADLRERGETPESFSDRVGWDVTSALASPEAAWKDWNVDCLQDVARVVGLRWLDVISSWRGRLAT